MEREIAEVAPPKARGRTSARSRPPTEALAESRGHLAWIDEGASEAFVADGLVYVAPASASIGRDGFRRGARWEGDIVDWHERRRREQSDRASEEAEPTPRPREPMHDPVHEVLDAARRILARDQAAGHELDDPRRGSFGDRKVFVSALWDDVGARLGMSLDEFKRWLVQEHRAQRLTLARADLVAAMDTKTIARSDIVADGARFNFVVVEPKTR